MKKLIPFVNLMMFSLTVFSQKDTVTIPVKCFPKKTVIKIAEELVKCDSIKEIHEYTKIQLNLYEKQFVYQNNKIDSLKKIREFDNQLIQSEKEKVDVLVKYNDHLSTQLKEQQSKNKVWKYVSSGVITILTIILIAR